MRFLKKGDCEIVPMPGERHSQEDNNSSSRDIIQFENMTKLMFRKTPHLKSIYIKLCNGALPVKRRYLKVIG